MLILSLAHAASITELPPFLRGDVVIGYQYDRLAGSLSEHGLSADDDVEVGKRAVQSHDMSYGLAFSVAPGAALTVRIPHTLHKSVGVSEWSQMVYDPATETGTYVGTATEADATSSEGSGVQGVWIGAKGTPFAEAFATRRNRATWLVEGALRTPSANNNWYTITEPGPVDGAIGERGAGEGGLALHVGTAASTSFGASEPYLALSWTDTLATEIAITADDGSVIDGAAEIDPGGVFDARFGTELVAGKNDASGARTAFDLHVRGRYTGASKIPTGTELPAVLVPDAGIVQQAESMELGAGLALNLRFFKYMELDLYGDGLYRLPQRIEHPYPVYTGGDTVHVITGANVVIRVR
ncbi:MAG: hypothetical protein FJ102_17225 [Deltaproteobacteria bacterium]|nr:hypothetical protein [Deltaproteobacteria bacterium]